MKRAYCNQFRHVVPRCHKTSTLPDPELALDARPSQSPALKSSPRLNSLKIKMPRHTRRKLARKLLPAVLLPAILTGIPKSVLSARVTAGTSTSAAASPSPIRQRRPKQ